VSSFRSTCPYRRNLFCCSISIISSISSLSLELTWNSVFYLNITHPSDHSHLCSLKCHLIFFPDRPSLTSNLKQLQKWRLVKQTLVCVWLVIHSLRVVAWTRYNFFQSIGAFCLCALSDTISNSCKFSGVEPRPSVAITAKPVVDSDGADRAATPDSDAVPTFVWGPGGHLTLNWRNLSNTCKTGCSVGTTFGVR